MFTKRFQRELPMADSARVSSGFTAYPSYQYWIIAGRRADATTALMDLANRLQRYYADNNTYLTVTIAPYVSPQGYYTLSISDKTATTYTI